MSIGNMGLICRAGRRFTIAQGLAWTASSSEGGGSAAHRLCWKRAVVPAFLKCGPGLRFGAGGPRWMSSDMAKPAPTASTREGVGGIPTAMLNQSSSLAAEQIKTLARKSWYQWMKDHQDELLVILLSSMFLVTTLRLQRVRGEGLDAKKESDDKIADLEGKISRLEAEIRASVENRASDIGKELRLWDSQVPLLKAAVLKAVEAGFKTAKDLDAMQEEKEKEKAARAEQAPTMQDIIGEKDRKKPTMI